MIIARNALVDALAIVRRHADMKSPIPILSHVRLEAGGGKLTLLAHALDWCATTSAPAEGSLAATCVPVEVLYRIANGFPRGASHLTLEIDREMIIKCGRSRYRLPTLPAVDMPDPLTPGEPHTSCRLTEAQVGMLFDLPRFAVETGVTRYYLCGIHLDGHDNHMRAVATDGHRMVCVDSDVAWGGAQSVIVPTRACEEIVRLAGDDGLALMWSERVLSVTDGMTTYATKLIDGTYPDYRRVIPDYAGAGWLECDPAELRRALDRLRAVAGPAIALDWEADPSTLLLTCPEGGREEIACSGEGKAGRIGLSPGQMRELAEAFTGDLMRLHYLGPDQALGATDPAQPGLLVIQMPRFMAKAKMEAA